MNKQSKNGIEWTDYTWNPVKGCLHGCRWHMQQPDVMFGDGHIEEAICYAEVIANKFNRAYPKGFEHIYWHPEILDAPKKIKTGVKIFLDSMSDLMGVGVEEDWIKQVLEVCAETPRHTYQLLTKNAPRLLKFDFPQNVWVGVSSSPDILMGKKMDNNRKKRYMHRALEVLSQVDAPVRWISFEPLNEDYSWVLKEHQNVIQWAVIGAASNGRKYYPPRTDHYERTLAELEAQSVPVFFKGNMKSLREAAINWREDFPV